jgi:predicted transcriptional regulator
MLNEITLTKADYDVFARLPTEWFDENVAACEIAQTLDQRSGVILRRIASFVRVGLVERRGGRTLTAKTEIRKVGK